MADFNSLPKRALFLLFEYLTIWFLNIRSNEKFETLNIFELSENSVKEVWNTYNWTDIFT